MDLAFIPLYIHLLGMEAFGLVGVNATLLAMFSLLDLGLSTTLNREIAKWSSQSSEAQEVRDLVRTLEIIYWVSALLIALITLVAAPLLAYHWFQVKDLPQDTVLTAIRMMGVSIAFQWSSTLYSGGLQGLQRHVSLNAVQAVAVTIRGGGAALALVLIAPKIEVFFGWYMFANGLMSLLLGSTLWRALPGAERMARFDKAILRRVGGFAAGMSGIAVVSLIVMQMDRVVLSRMLSLDALGYYTLAVTVASVLLRVVGPFSSAVFPRLVQLKEVGDELALSRLYHKSCQVVAVVVAPITLLIALFAWQLLLLWTGKTVTAANAHLPLSLLVIGFGLLALLQIPYMLQLAYGWASLAFWQNVVSVVVLFPLLVWLVGLYGAPGAAAVWLLLNVGYFLLIVPIMHTRLLTGQQARWYGEDVGLPVVAAAVATLCGWFLFHNQSSRIILLFGIAATWLIATLAAALSAPRVRQDVLQIAGKLRR